MQILPSNEEWVNSGHSSFWKCDIPASKVNKGLFSQYTHEGSACVCQTFWEIINICLFKKNPKKTNIFVVPFRGGFL